MGREREAQRDSERGTERNRDRERGREKHQVQQAAVMADGGRYLPSYLHNNIIHL